MNNNTTADALCFAVTKVYTLNDVTKWIEDNPLVAVRGIYPDMGNYLIVHWKTSNEIMELRSKLSEKILKNEMSKYEVDEKGFYKNDPEGRNDL